MAARKNEILVVSNPQESTCMRLVKTALYIFGIMALALSAHSASGQSKSIYGLDEETKPINSAITMDEALSAFHEYIDASLALDYDYLLVLLTEPFKTRVDNLIKKQGIEKLRAEAKLRAQEHTNSETKWFIHCAACWNDTTEGPICLVEDRQHRLYENNNYTSSLYLMKNVNGQTYLSDGYAPKNKLGRKLRKRAKKNGWKCGIEK